MPSWRAGSTPAWPCDGHADPGTPWVTKGWQGLLHVLVAKCGGKGWGWGALCQAGDPGTSARCQLSSCLSSQLGACVSGERTDPPVLPWGCARAPRASGRRVQKVQASTWWVTPAAAMGPNLSLPSRPRRCCLPAGAERSGDPLRRDREHGGKDPERHPQLSRASVLGHRGVHAAELCLEGPPRQGTALGQGCWALGGAWPLPCLPVTLHWSRVCVCVCVSHPHALPGDS